MADLTIPIIGLLGFLGYKLNNDGNGKTSRKQENIRKDISPYELPSGKNIYESNFSREITQNEQKLSDIQYEKAKDPVNTNIIPPFYNTYCKIDCPQPEIIDSRTTLLPKIKPITSSLNKQILSGPMFNNMGISTLNSSGPIPVMKEEFNNISQLSGQKLDMSHNNMVPFFRGNAKQNTNINAFTSKLESFTGISNITSQPKKEVLSMFAPIQQNIYGSAVSSSLISQDRYVQSNLKTNLLPTPQIKVQPIPEESLRPAYKTVDDLRVKTKPKTSFTTPVIQGKAINDKRGLIGKVSKNNPDTYFVNTPDRYFTTLGANTRPAIRENFNVSKSDNKVDIASTPFNLLPAGSSISKTNIRYSKDPNITDFVTIVEDDKKHIFKNDWIRNAKNNINKSNFNDINSYTVYEQERDTTNRMTLLPPKDANKGNYHAFTDDAKTTHKEGNLFSYTGNAKSDINAPKDYTADYNYTREKQYINNYNYISTPGTNDTSIANRDAYNNINITTNRSEIVDRKGYVPGASNTNTSLGTYGVNIHMKDDSYQSKYAYRSNVDKNYQQPTNSSMLGCNTNLNDSNNSVKDHDFSNRIDADLVKSFNDNPYTQRLDSY